MFEGTFGLSPYAEISLDRLSKVMDNRLTAIHKFIDVIVEQIFQNQPAEEIVLRRSVIGDLARADFYAAIKRSLTKHLKKFARTIEELALHREKNGGGWEWLKGMMDSLEKSTASVYRYIRTMEANFLWEYCKFPACEDRRSFELFRKDVIVYLMSVSNIVRKVVKEASSRRQIGHVLSGLQLQGWQQRQNQAEIELQMQQSCAETHRQKKKKRNKKAKVAVVQQQRREEKKEEVVSEEEAALKAFLQSLEVEEERERCTVSEEWISRISPSSFFKK